MFNTSMNKAFITQILTSIREGKLGYCKQLGFDEKELAEISQLSTNELQDICETTVPFIKVEVNHNILWNNINNAKNKTLEMRTIDRALELGISGEMLRQRFGWSSAEVSGRRQLLGIKEHIGRKSNATEEDEHKLYELWEIHRPADVAVMNDKNQGLNILILLAEESDLSLTEVWRLVESWIKMEK